MLPLDLPELLKSWEIMLLAENKSPTTISSDERGVRLYLTWCEQSGHPMELTRSRIQEYLAELIAEGKEANTVRLRFQASQRMGGWTTSTKDRRQRCAATAQ